MINDFTIQKAHYSKNMIAVRTPSNDAYKTRACYLAEALANGRYSGREHAYIMSPRRAALFKRLYWLRWNASPFTYLLDRNLDGDRADYTPQQADKLTRPKK